MNEQVHDDERVIGLVEHALSLPANEREEFLRKTCGDDPDLLRIVLGYIQNEERMKGFLLEPLNFGRRRSEYHLQPGEILVDRFRIVREVAQGGMGVVYEAIDEHLERRIALKCAKAGYARRLRPEVRHASEIGHPNVCKIYEIYSAQTRAGSIDFITMEFLEGDTLATRLRLGALPKAEARAIALQLCAGVAEAHRKGVIHGDLKTNNVILTPDGKGGIRAVITDFGLARNAAVLGDGSLGLPGGTPGYMAPELLLGEKPTVASDIFALGVVLCEMLGPRKLEDTLAYFSQNDSPVTQPFTPAESPSTEERLPPKWFPVHSAWERVLIRCLEPDPARRFKTADDLLNALNPASRRRRLLSAALAAVFVVVCVLFWRQWVINSRDSSPLTLRQLTAGDIETSVSLSPDAKRVVYSSDRSGVLNLWLQELTGGEPVRLTSDTSSNTDAVFSPDGMNVAFRSERAGGGVYVTSVPPVGEPRLIGPEGRNPAYSPDGKWITYWQGLPSEGDTQRAGSAKCFVVPVDGGASRQVAVELSNCTNPLFSPDSNRVLVRSQLADKVDKTYFMVNLATGRSTQLHFAAQLAGKGFYHPFVQVWTRTGIYLRAGRGDEMNIWFAPAKNDLELTGPPRLLATGISETSHVSVAAHKLVFYNGTQQNAIWLLPMDANRGRGANSIIRVESPRPGDLAHPNLSPDGKHLVFRVFAKSRVDLVVRDLETGSERVIAQAETPELAGRFLQDNSSVIYEAGISGDANVSQWDAATGKATFRFQHGAAEGPSADGNWISYWRRNKNGSNSIWVAERGGGAPVEVVTDHHSQLYVSHFSPDGKWICFIARNGTEQARVFIAPFRGLTPVAPSDWIPVSRPPFLDDKPEWSPDGNLLYFVSDRDGFRCIWAQHLRRSNKRPVGAPFPIRHFHELRSSMKNVNLGAQELSVSADKLGFLLSEQSGGIWTGDLPESIR